MLEDLHFKQLSYGKKMAEYVDSRYVFYDPMEEYIERLGNGNDWLYLYYKDQFLCYNLLPLSLSSLFFYQT